MRERGGRDLWDETAAFYDATRAFPGDGERLVPAAVAARLSALGASRVLDLGCGTGRFTLPLAEAGLRVVGADRSPEMLAVLARKPGARRAGVVRCDALHLPFRRAFDAVVFAHFLHLVPSMEGLAAELRHVLVPGAHVIVVDSTSRPNPAEMRVLAIVMPILEGRWKQWPHGEETKTVRLLRELLGHLGGSVAPFDAPLTFANATTLRETLRHVRERTWSSCRVHPEAETRRAADAAERRLLDESADLDAPVDAPVEVRLVVGRLPD
jgi:ubiquinone/menaquinone biosynthesis C-methylase UbiE